MTNSQNLAQKGFTIVELLVVVAVIAILAAIGFVSYGKAQDRAKEAVLRSDLSSAAELLNADKIRTGVFPEGLADADKGNGIPASEDTTYQYTVDNASNPKTFCLTASNESLNFFLTESTESQSGVCPGHNS